MGKSTKKAATKVDSIPAVAPAKPLKKGKREIEDTIQKPTSAKKQKKDYIKEDVAKKEAEVKVVKKKASSISSDDSEEEQKVKVPANKAPAKLESSSEKSSPDDEPAPVPVAAANNGSTKKGMSSSSMSDSSDESDSGEEDPKSKAAAIKNGKPAVAKKQAESSDESDSDDDTSSNEQLDQDTEMVETEPIEEKAPKTPFTPKAQTSEGSKTIFVGNLPFSVEKADVENFFKDAGEVVDVRFALHPDGAMRGFGHVEFSSADEARKAVDLNGQELMGRSLRIDLAKERGEYTPQSGFESNSYQKAERPQGQTIFIRGFDKNEDRFQIQSALQEHFGSCGEITRVSIPTDPDGYVKGIAYMDFQDKDGFNKALELDQSEFGQSVLTVEEAKPRDVKAGSGGRGGGGRRGGRFASGGRDSGGRGRGGRGGRFGSGGRGRGKKTTYND